MDWFPDSRGIAVQRQSRDQKTLELLRFDAISGRSRVLLTERSEHWVPLHRELTFLQRAKQFIWASSRDGYQHLYLYANDGALIRPLTRGEFMVVGAPADPRCAPSMSARDACISRPTCPRPSSGSCSGCRWTSRPRRSA